MSLRKAGREVDGRGDDSYDRDEEEEDGDYEDGVWEGRILEDDRWLLGGGWMMKMTMLEVWGGLRWWRFSLH